MVNFFKFADYVENLNFENSSNEGVLQSFYRFLCTIGNKETEFTTMFSSELDRYLASKFPNYWLVGNRKIPNSLRSGYVFEVTKAKSGIDDPFDKRWDLLLFEHKGQDDLRAIIEFKTNRHNAFLDEVEFLGTAKELSLATQQTNTWSSVGDKKYWKDVLFYIEMMYELRKSMPEVEIWHGTLLYSLFSPKTLKKPEIIGQYLGEEPESREKSLINDEVSNQAEFNALCDRDTKLFMRILSSELPRMHIAEPTVVNSGSWVHKIVASGEHRGIYVRSDLVLLKVAG
jgi:hypothetical protein